MPTIEDLKFEIRDAGTREKLYAIEAVDVDADPQMLLEYLKNEYTQKNAVLYGLSVLCLGVFTVLFFGEFSAKTTGFFFFV